MVAAAARYPLSFVTDVPVVLGTNRLHTTAVRSARCWCTAIVCEPRAHHKVQKEMGLRRGPT